MAVKKTGKRGATQRMLEAWRSYGNGRAGSGNKKAAETLRQPSGYEEVLLDGVLRGRGWRQKADGALFASAVASMAESLRVLRFARGIKAGKVLYSLCARSGEYRNPLLGLPDFFGNAGYPRMRYERNGRSFAVRMQSQQASVGANIHAFEAGLVSGFLGIAEGRPVLLSESACSANGSEYCVFEEAPARGSTVEPDDLSEWLLRLLQEGAPRSSWGINSYYSNLIWETALHSMYSAEIRGIVHYYGDLLGRITRRDNRKPEKELGRMLDSLALGRMRVEGKASFHVIFDAVSMRRRFTDISLAFASGFLGGNLQVSEQSGGYSISILQ